MKKLILLCLTLLMTMSFVISGLSLAFFSDQKSVGSTVFEMGSLSLTSINTYSANDDPYTYVKHPSWTVQNTGSLNLILKVKVLCAWAPQPVIATEPEASELVTETGEVVADISEVVNVTSEVVAENETESILETEIMSEPSNEIESVTEIELFSESVVEMEIMKEQPSYVISLPNDLWFQDENGWYVYRYPVLPNEVIQVDAQIMVIDPDWQGGLELFFEAEANAGGDL